MTEFLFETPRLFCKPWRLTDAPEALEMYGDPEVTRYIGGQPEPDLQSVTRRLQDVIRRNRGLPLGMGSFAVRLKETRQLVGSALLRYLPDTNDQPTSDVEIGWHLAKRHWGNGYATEFGHKLLEIGFQQVDLELIHAVVDPPNVASQRVAERLGMKLVGTTTAYYRGEPILHYELDASSFSEHY